MTRSKSHTDNAKFRFAGQCKRCDKLKTASNPQLDCLKGLKIARELGRGDIGVAYELHPGAQNHSLNSDMSTKGEYVLKATKISSQAALKSFQDEVCVGKYMGELGIAPRIYACWVCSKRGSGFPAMGYYVMQKIDFIYGEKFPSKSLPGKPAPPAVEKQLVNVVAKMVSHGIIHNDLHPGNIGVLKNGKLVIFDYGFSQRADVEIKFPEQVLMAQLYTIIEQYAKPIMFNSLIYDTIYKIRQGKLKL